MTYKITVIDITNDEGDDGFYFDFETNVMTIRTIQGCFEQKIQIPPENLVDEYDPPKLGMSPHQLDEHPHSESIKATFKDILADTREDAIDEIKESLLDDISFDFPPRWT